MIRETMNGKTYFKFRETKNTTLDRLALGMLENNEIKGFMPFRYVVREESYFSYDAGNDVTLEEWMNVDHGKSEVLMLLESMADAGSELEKYLLDSTHVCMEYHYIIVRNDKCVFAYIPVNEYTNGGMVQNIGKLLKYIKYMMDDDYTYLFDLMNAYERDSIQSLLDLKKWIWHQTKEPNPVPVQTAVLMEGVIPGVQENEVESREELKPEKKKGFLFHNKKKVSACVQEEITQEKVIEEENLNIPIKPIYEDDECEEETVFVGDDQKIGVLVRQRTGTVYHLTEANYEIGNQNMAEIAIVDNRAVSKHHAKIMNKNNTYTITDLGSTNGTFVNGRRIMVNEPYELERSVRISIANEEFVFEIRSI